MVAVERRADNPEREFDGLDLALPRGGADTNARWEDGSWRERHHRPSITSCSHAILRPTRWWRGFRGFPTANTREAAKEDHSPDLAAKILHAGLSNASYKAADEP